MRSLSHDAAMVLVHAFVTSRIDHSCSVFVGLPLGLIGRHDRVLRPAARFIGHIPKYASVSAYMRDVLQWLPGSQRILFRISTLVWRSVTGCYTHTHTHTYCYVYSLPHVTLHSQPFPITRLVAVLCVTRVTCPA